MGNPSARSGATDGHAPLGDVSTDKAPTGQYLWMAEQLMTDAVEKWSYSSRNVRVHMKVGVGYAATWRSRSG